jgi:hypothetical protein
MAASATFALKAGAWFRRGRLLMVSPDSRDKLARRQAETPLIALCRFPRPALQSDQDPPAELALPYSGLVSIHTCSERGASAVAYGVSPDLVSTPSATQPIARGASIYVAKGADEKAP